MSTATASGPLFIVSGRTGGLGNRLFFFSYVLSLAMKVGGRVTNPGFIDYARYFIAPSEDALSRWPARPSLLRAKWLGEILCRVVNLAERIIHKLRLPLPGVKILGLHEDRTTEYRLDHAPFLDAVQSARMVFISGWLELGHIRFEHPEKIRAHFTPVEPHRLAVAKLITQAREHCDVLIGVHIRQGDYEHFLGGRFHFDTEVYIRAMLAAAALFPGRKVGFLVCSNLPQKISHPDLPAIHFGTGQLIEDLYALADCDYLIGPPSTFSLWASFYGQVPLWEMHDATSTPKLEEFLVRF